MSSILFLIGYNVAIALIVWGSSGIAYRMGYKQGQQEMHWAHFDKGCYLDGKGEVYEHLRDEVQP